MEFLRKERYYILFLALLIALAGVIIVPLKHSVDQGDGHLKDEEGFYSWAELYNDGYYSLPIEEANGEYSYKQSFSSDPRVTEIDLETKVQALDANGIADDLYVKLEWKNGTPLSDARLKVVLKQGKSRTNFTDDAGEAILKDLQFGPRPLEVMVPTEPPIIFHRTVEVQGDRVIYGIYSETEVEVLTDNTLENRTVQILNENGTPAEGLALLFFEREVGISDQKGEVRLWGMDVKSARFRVVKPITTNNGRTVYENVQDIRVVFQGQDRPVKEAMGTFDCSVNDTVRLEIVVLDTFKRPVGNVNVTLDGRSIGLTNDQGILVHEEEMDQKEHVLDLHKKVDGYEIPLISGVGMVDDEPHYINHWPPGPSVALSWFMKFGVEDFFGLFFYALLAVSTYLLTRRFLGFRFALVAAVLVMSNSIVIMLLYGQWMGDLSSPALALFGMFMFVEATELMFKDKKLLPAIFYVISGLSFAAGVSMRYSGIVLCFAPVVYLVLRLVPREKIQLKKVFSVKNLKRSVFAAVPWVIGLLIIGLILASYNNAYFGGPFNSGYQSSRRLFAVSGEEGNATLETYEADENFFKAYFDYKEEDVENMPNVFAFLICLVPLLFVCIPVILLVRRPIVAGLLVWIIAVFVIYLSQGWVLSNTLGDIRYYLPLVPAAGILATILIREVYKSKAWKNRKNVATLVVFVVIGLLILSHGMASAEVLEWEYNRFSGQRNRQPQGGVPQDNGDQPVQVIAVDFALFNATPDDYLGKVVKFEAKVERILNPNAFIIGTTREFVVFVDGGADFPVGQRVLIQGLVEDDKQKPGEYVIRCTANDVTPLGSEGGDEPPNVIVLDFAVFNATPEDYLGEIVELEAVVERILNPNAFVIGTDREFVVHVEGGANVSVGQMLSIQGLVDEDDKKPPGEYMIRSKTEDVKPVEDGTRSVVTISQTLPPKDNNPPPKSKPEGLKPSKTQKRSGVLGVGAALILVCAGIYCKIKGRMERKREPEEEESPVKGHRRDRRSSHRSRRRSEEEEDLDDMWLSDD